MKDTKKYKIEENIIECCSRLVGRHMKDIDTGIEESSDQTCKLTFAIKLDFAEQQPAVIGKITIGRESIQDNEVLRLDNPDQMRLPLEPESEPEPEERPHVVVAENVVKLAQPKKSESKPKAKRARKA